MILSRRAAVSGVLAVAAAPAIAAPTAVSVSWDEWLQLESRLRLALDRMGWRHPGYGAGIGVQVAVEGARYGVSFVESDYTRQLVGELPLIGARFHGAFSWAFCGAAFAGREGDWPDCIRTCFDAAMRDIEGSLVTI